MGDQTEAIYFPAESKLLFRSFRTTNPFLPLMDYYQEASEQDIRDILDHDKLSPEDPDAIAIGASQWFRTRFALLKDSQVLDDYSPQEIANDAQGYNLEIGLDQSNGDTRIIFPAVKAEAKKLLQFLNEEIYKGAITEKLYETNSKRETE